MLFLLKINSVAQPITFRQGSFIVNMGMATQTVGNALKPYGLVYDLIKNYDIPIYRIINQTKTFEGNDFSYDGINYKGGPFIIPGEYITSAVRARISWWQSQGVAGTYTTSALTLTPAQKFTSVPNWSLDAANGSIAERYLINAGMPSSAYNWTQASALGACNDIYAMPGTSPHWNTHGNLYSWNLSAKGSIWLGGQSVSSMANMYNPADTSQQTSFLVREKNRPGFNPVPGVDNYAENALLLPANHVNGTPGYNTVTGTITSGSRAGPADPVAQFMDKSDNSHRNGTEQIYLPVAGGGWLNTTQVITYDPTHSNVPSISPGPAVLVAYGRAFGNAARGYVMYEAGHDLYTGTDGDIPAQRAFLNWSFLASQEKAPTISSVTGIPANGLMASSPSPQNYNLTVNYSSPVSAALSSVTWSCTKSPDGSSFGSFTPNGTEASVNTVFTPDPVDYDTQCTITVKIVDVCGRTDFKSYTVIIKPPPPPLVNFGSGSFIVNMGVNPQTIANSLKPYGLVYDLIKNYKVPVHWIINPDKNKEGIDFTHNGIDYKGGPFIIPEEYLTSAVRARITYWQGLGVTGAYSVSDLSLPSAKRLTSVPNWTLDTDNGSLVQDFFTNASIPPASYNWLLPSQLGVCNDLFVMPHADPVWATHGNLYNWNLTARGAIWLGCHAGSALSNMYNPADTSQQTNFLVRKINRPGFNAVPGSTNYAENTLLLWGNHGDGVVPYNTITGYIPSGTMASASDPVLQFMGVSDLAHNNGSERIYLPVPGGSWLSSTKIITYDPDQSDILDGDSPGPAAVMAYGRAFGDPNRGHVMYEAGHELTKGTAGDIPAQRAFFNWSFLTAYDKTPVINSLTGIPPGNTVYAEPIPQNYNLSVNYTTPGGSAISSVTWSCTRISDGQSYGSFSPNGTLAAINTIFTPDVVNYDAEIVITVRIEDVCGRFTFDSYPVTVKAFPHPPTSVTVDRSDVCQDDAGNITLTATGGSGLTLKWYTSACQETLIGTGNLLTIPSPEVSTTYYAAWSNDMGTSTCASVNVNVVSVPSSPVVDGRSVCTGNSTILNASGAGPGENYKWYSALTGGTLLQTNGSTFTTPVLNSTTTYYVSVYNTALGCESPRSPATVTVNSFPAIPSVSDVTICYNNQAVLTATGASSGNFYKWYNAQTGGTLLKTSADHNDNTYTTTNLTTLTSYWVSVISPWGCESSVQRANVNVQANVTAGIIGTTQTICYNESVTLSNVTSGTGSGVLSYQWEKSTDNGASWTMIAGAVGSTYNTGNLASTTLYRRTTVSVLNGRSCYSAATPAVTLTVQPLITPGTITATESAICSGEPFVLTGTAAGPAGLINYRWEISSDGVNWSNAPIPNNTQNYSYPSAAATTHFRRIVYYPGPKSCTTWSDPVTITVQLNPPVPALSVNNPEVCEGGSVIITATPSNLPSATYTLHYVDDGSGIYPVLPPDVTNSTGIFTVNPIIGKHRYTVSLTEGICASISDPVEISVYDKPNFLASGSLISSCTTNNDGFIYVNYQLEESNFDPGEQIIEFSFDNGANWSSNPYKDGLGEGTYTVIIRNRAPDPSVFYCSTSADIIISFEVITTTDQTICQGDTDPAHRTLSAVSYCYASSGNEMNYRAIPPAENTFRVAANPIPYDPAYPQMNPLYVPGPLVRYFTYSFNVDMNGLWEVSAEDGNSNPPNRVSLYKFPFDPENPARNLLAMDNTHGPQGNNGVLSDVMLYENTEYVVVISYYNENVPAPPQNDIKIHLDNDSGIKYVQRQPTPPNWFIRNADGTYTLIHTGPTIDPLEVPGSGLLNTDLPGSWTYYVGCPDGDCMQPAILTIEPIPYPHASGSAIFCSDLNTDILLSSTMLPSGAIITPAGKVKYTWTAQLISSTNPSLVTGYSDCLTEDCGNRIQQPVRNNTEDPAVIRYTIYAAVGDCPSPASITFDLTVNPLPGFTIDPLVQNVVPDVNIIPITITPSNSVNNLTYTWSRNNGAVLYPGIPLSGTGDPAGFTIEGILPSAQPLIAHTTTFTFRALVNNYACVTKTASVTVQDNVPPSITCPDNITVACSDEVPPKAMDYDSFILQTGASASDNGPFLTVTWISDDIAGSPNYTITRTYMATDGVGNTTTCTQVINVIDDQLPVWLQDPVDHREYCVENIVYASWDLQAEPLADIRNTVDATPVRPDYHILTDLEKSAYYLDPQIYFHDNCTPTSNIILHWKIVAVSTGDYVTDLEGRLLDDETDALIDHGLKLEGAPNGDVYYNLVYWLEDSYSNLSGEEKTVLITIKPRPLIIKMNE